jgi:hypothetical protein
MKFHHHNHRDVVTHVRIRKRKPNKGETNTIIIHHTIASSRLFLLGLGCCIYLYGYYNYYYNYLCTFHKIDRDVKYLLTTITTPTSLRMNVQEYLQQLPLPNVNQLLRSTSIATIATLPMDVDQYWSVLHNYAVINNQAKSFSASTLLLASPTVRANNIDNNQTSLSTNTTINTTTGSTNIESACTDPPGHGWEGGHGAYQLLKHKIQIAPNHHHHHHHHPLRLLCAIYTHEPNHDLVRMAALTWGLQCDGFIAFTNSTTTHHTTNGNSTSTMTPVISNNNNNNPLLGIISIPQIGIESYNNMWQKTRAIWHYIYTNQYSDYDYIHLSGDDIYLLVPNLKHFLYTQEQQQQLQSDQSTHDVFAGQWVRQKNRPYLGGGPGYTISRSVLQQYIQKAYSKCYPNLVSSAEDRYFSLCIKAYTNISLTDTRDIDTGEQTYHDVAPQQVYDGRPTSASSRKIPSFHSRAVSYYEQLPPPIRRLPPTSRYNIPTTSNNVTSVPWRTLRVTSLFPETKSVVGPKYGSNAAAKYSISFHKISSPLFMLRIHAILYPSICVSNDDV